LREPPPGRLRRLEPFEVLLEPREPIETCGIELRDARAQRLELLLGLRVLPVRVLPVRCRIPLPRRVEPLEKGDVALRVSVGLGAMSTSRSRQFPPPTPTYATAFQTKLRAFQ